MNNAPCVDNEICGTNTIVPEKCPPGEYTNPAQSGAMSVANCLSCPANRYCPEYGLDDGDMNPTSGTSAYLCPDGYVCMGGAIHPSNLDEVTIKLCPEGWYCPSGQGTELVCQINYYNPMKGQTTCVVCAQGFECPDTGLIWPSACPAGKYCPTYDPANSDMIAAGTNALNCPAGTYSSN